FSSVCFSVCFLFFFSSRRRHTRFSRDWSSDVCSSDLRSFAQKKRKQCMQSILSSHLMCWQYYFIRFWDNFSLCPIRSFVYGQDRSEERRVGKECESGWSPYS